MNLLHVQGVLPLDFNLRYNSLLVNQPSPVGKGWETTGYDARLQFLPQGDVLVHWSANRYNLFQRQADGSYRSSHAGCAVDTLAQNADSTWPLIRGSPRRMR